MMNRAEIEATFRKTLSSILPAGWTKACVYAYISEFSEELFFYVFTEREQAPIQCYNLPGIDPEQIDDAMDALADFLRSLGMVEEGAVNTFILQKDGAFDMSTDRKLPPEEMYSYLQQWKERYLK